MSRKPIAENFIHFQERENGRRYAKFCPADRKYGGKDIYLGVVIDETNCIFYNRKNGGFYRFTIEGGRQELTTDERTYYEVVKKGCGKDTPRKVLALDFGDACIFSKTQGSGSCLRIPVRERWILYCRSFLFGSLRQAPVVTRSDGWKVPMPATCIRKARISLAADQRVPRTARSRGG